MPAFLGIDTSNYTTSVAIYDSDTGNMISEKKLLPVTENTCGLRQSDAVFLHIKQLGELVEAAFSKTDNDIAAVGFSAFPRDCEGSYMPCFLVGQVVARSVAASHHIGLYEFSHQRGHIAAAIYSLAQPALLKEPFLAFHISGGTTELLFAEPDDKLIIKITCVGKTLDLNAGQAIDRVGVKLGLGFPCGRELEQLANKSDKSFNPHPCVKGMDCAISGLENQAEKMIKSGVSPQDVAKYCIEFIYVTVDAMCKAATEKYSGIPIIFAGGVMSNAIIRKRMEKKYGGLFAQPHYSSDNAAGIAYLCSVAAEKK